ncbi:methyltransferase domain-containing protein [Nocardia sp. NPDC057663]|uniref:methyltransferase domain-containing protein n=1 Tax=Nocardia sp. NPDC057663 TaxID=3346201 RepID=UPI00366AC08C
MKHHADGEVLGEFLVSARSLAEYRAMFHLSDDDLTGRRILDCPGGAASFTAEATTLGAAVTAVDPIYARSTTELSVDAVTENDRAVAWAAANAHRYRWDWYGSPAGHAAIRRGAARRFADHVRAEPHRYVAASLPELPFPDGSFDLALSSHLLFSYADRLDADFHLSALLELSRVTEGEARLYPLLDYTGAPLDDLIDHLRTELHDKGIPTALRKTRYEFHHGADTMLVLQPAA